MDKKEKDCGLLIAVLLVGVALGTVVGLGLAGFVYPVYQSNEWANWASAFGAFGAASAAVWVALRAESTNRRLRAGEAKLKIQGLKWDLVDISSYLANAQRDLLSYKDWLDSNAPPGKEERVNGQLCEGLISIRAVTPLILKFDWLLFAHEDYRNLGNVQDVFLSLRQIERQMTQGEKDIIKLLQAIDKLNSNLSILMQQVVS